MDPTFKPEQHEEKIYSFWEKKGYLTPKKGTPYTIIMPPPNANASLHAGHGMYTVDDIMIRWKRLQGFASLWIPGMDHAGFETQFVYEKQLRKQGKSRFDFDRETLYKNIFDFVSQNSGLIYEQFKSLGFLADWDRSVFTLDKKVIATVYKTFKKMVDDNYVYRDNYIVNYCVHCGTSLAELEVKHIERVDPLYYVRYPLVGTTGFVVVATVRPEPIFVDTHLAVNPKDPKRNGLIGKKVKNPLTGVEMLIIGDEFVDPEFGTGVVKLTPAHDHNDFVVAKKRGLPIVPAIDTRGRIMPSGGKYAGMKVRQAREAVVNDLEQKGLIEKIDNNYLHSVSACYRCGRDLEPLTIPNWFIKVDRLKKPVFAAVKKNQVKFVPGKFKKQMLDWLEVMHDWPISRQIVWGIRIPAWQCQDCHEWIVTEGDIPKNCDKCNSASLKQDPDTFDTWFSSGQWPLVVLKRDELTTRFPTDFMGTLSDILKFWISRMLMFSLYLKNEVPFKTVYLWSMVADQKGMKMSKSRGNVVNPIDLVDKYGADAFRASLLFGIGQGGTIILAEDKVRAMRNFANKIWNVARFIKISKSGNKQQTTNNLQQDTQKTVNNLKKEFATLKKKIIEDMDLYQFSRAFDALYEFLWHRMADFYIEQLKIEVASGMIEAQEVLEAVYLETIVLLHPFMPFVTEAVWKELNGQSSSILDERLKN